MHLSEKNYHIRIDQIQNVFTIFSKYASSHLSNAFHSKNGKHFHNSYAHTHTHFLSFKVEFSKNQPFSLILFLLKWNKKKFVNYCKFVQSKYLISMKTQNKKRNNMGKRKIVSFNPCSNHSILPKFRPFVNRFPHTTKKWVLFLAFSENCSYWNRFIPYKNKCRTTDEFIHMNLPSVRDVVLVRKVFFKLYIHNK